MIENKDEYLALLDRAQAAEMFGTGENHLEFVKTLNSELRELHRCYRSDRMFKEQANRVRSMLDDRSKNYSSATQADILGFVKARRDLDHAIVSIQTDISEINSRDLRQKEELTSVIEAFQKIATSMAADFARQAQELKDELRTIKMQHLETQLETLRTAPTIAKTELVQVTNDESTEAIGRTRSTVAETLELDTEFLKLLKSDPRGKTASYIADKLTRDLGRTITQKQIEHTANKFAKTGEVFKNKDMQPMLFVWVDKKKR